MSTHSQCETYPPASCCYTRYSSHCCHCFRASLHPCSKQPWGSSSSFAGCVCALRTYRCLPGHASIAWHRQRLPGHTSPCCFAHARCSRHAALAWIEARVSRFVHALLLCVPVWYTGHACVVYTVERTPPLGVPACFLACALNSRTMGLRTGTTWRCRCTWTATPTQHGCWHSASSLPAPRAQ